MHKNLHTSAVGQPPRSHNRQPRVRERMNACLSQDRLEALRENEDREIIRSSLNICERISKAIGKLSV